MKLIECNNIKKSYGSQEVLRGASFSISSGNCYGLIGPNGCGKTTLLHILTKTEELSSGHVTCMKDLRIGYVRQFLEHDPESTVREFLLSPYGPLIQKMREAENKLEFAGADTMEKLLTHYQKVREEYDEAECDLLDQRAEQILDSFGLADKIDQNTSDLSGGEKSMLNLAGALLNRPDLLILDEPGNHLDFMGLAWLEDFLSKFKGTILLVSHNRYLLDRITTHILELEAGVVTTYKGNYSAYRMEKLTKAVADQADYKAGVQRIKRLEAVVKRFEVIARNIADPAWGKRLRAKRSQLEQLKESSPDRPKLDNNKIKLNLDSPGKKSKVALAITDFTFGFENNMLYENASFELYRGERAALIGPNGAGKTTLLKKIIGSAESDTLDVRLGPGLKVGYLSQKQDIFDPELTVEDEIRSLGPLSKNDAFKLISPFLFTYEDLDKKIGTLSGGEKNRLQLAVLRYTKPDFLLLDEPTNHLDIASREAIEEALADFSGTMLIVSHDRYFLDKLADRIVEIKDKKLNGYTGNFSEYQALNIGFKLKLSGTGSKSKSKQKKNQTGGNVSNELGRLEERITELEAEKMELEKQVAAFFHKQDHKSGKKAAERLSKVVRFIDDAYKKWESMV